MPRQAFFRLIAASILLLAGCDKQEADSSAEPSDGPQRVTKNPSSIKGGWELRELIGGFRAPNSDTSFPADNGYIWKFDSSTYEIYDKGQLADTGIYVLTKDSSQATGRLMDALLFPDNHNDIIHFEIIKDTLVMYRGVIPADGTISRYIYLGGETDD